MERSFRQTIRGKLLSRTLVIVLVPILALGGVAYVALTSLSNTADGSVSDAQATLENEVVGARVADVSEQVSREIAVYLDERINDAQAWASSPLLIAAAQDAATEASALGLVGQEIEALESEYGSNPRLGDVGAERELLLAVENVPAFGEIFFTDVNGYNVDFSNQTSDFVQSDEGWWTSAMADGTHFSEPEFDASAGVFAVDISLRMDDTAGNPVGVMKAALDIQIVQVITERFSGTADSFDLTVLSATSGGYLAETSTNHAGGRIMADGVSGQDGNARVQEVFADNAASLHPDGYSIHTEWVAGYSHVDDALIEFQPELGASIAAFDWVVIVEQPSDVAFAALEPLVDLQTSITDTSAGLTLLIMLITAAGIAAAVLFSLFFARRITAPIGQLRDAAVLASEVRLPEVVGMIDQLDPDEELPELEQVTIETGDEVEDLAHSFNAVQQTAANLAAEQARMRRRNVATTFVNLGRRNQNLLSRQLEHINTMESTETDSDTLQRLFQLDHLATRMRRNAESLLVLAGEETPRRFRKPVSMHQLIQAAGGEIEDFGRVEITALDEASVEGGAASDVAHLLAELLENASHFSPPGAPIQVHGRRRNNGYTLSVIDQGIGMEEEEIAEANARLSDPAEFDRAPSAYLGHFVAGHLARRHGLRIRLVDSPYGGVTVQINMPDAILASVETPSMAPTGEVPAGPMDDDSPIAPVTPINPDVTVGMADIEQAAAAPVEPAPIAETPAPAEAPTPEPIAEAPTPEPVAQTPAPMPAPEPVLEAPAPAPIAQPDPVVEAPTPAPAPAPEPVAEAPAPMAGGSPSFDDIFSRIEKPQASTPAPDLTSSPAPAPIAAPAPEAPAPIETTPSGFRKRRKGLEGAPAPSASTAPAPAASAPRDPRQVQESLMRFRSGVEQGRATGQAQSHPNGEAPDNASPANPSPTNNGSEQQ